ncbi:MAG TPA: GyrI-like domain-containing protein, partial [Kineosporiaceae bacterium]|nr:GyrI-like domain-containing protein [Kineosporiaceae bacterium]
MSYEVSVRMLAARPTAVVAATTTWREFPGLWKGMLDEVWASVTAAGLGRECRNVMVYWDDVPRVEVGVELLVPCRLQGRVVVSRLPAGPVAWTVHRGPYSGLASAHRAVRQWCAE